MSTSDNWPVGYVMVCPSCNAATEMAVDDIDPTFGPYVNSAGVKMYNFECPQCHTQNGISENTTPKVSPASEPAEAVSAPVADVATSTSNGTGYTAEPAPSDANYQVAEVVTAHDAAPEAAAASEPFAGHPSAAVAAPAPAANQPYVDASGVRHEVQG